MMTTAFLVLYIILLITISIIIINTSTPSKALAYLFLIITFPIVGIIFYFSVGVNHRVNKLYNKKLEIDKKAFPALKDKLNKYIENTLLSFKDSLKHFYNIAKFIHNENLLTSNNSIDLLINGEKKFPKVIDALLNAKHHIHIYYYIYENDTIGNQVGDILKEKARQGIRVRFIYDDFGSQKIRAAFLESLKQAGVEAFPFYKIRWLLFANRINYRNHRKIIVIDGKIGFVGGINVSDKYINPNKKVFWRDTHLKIEGPAVLYLQKVFLEDWNFCTRQKLGITDKLFPIKSKNIFKSTNQLVQIISSGPDSNYPNIKYAMIQAIMLAKKEILITTPYFVPDVSFIDALKIARLSNIDIKIIVPDVSDSFIVNATSKSYYQELLEIGVEIYKYNKGFVHAKTMIFDNFLSTVGTTNLDQRSFDLNFEINAFIYDTSFSETLRVVFFEDIRNSTKLDLLSWKNRNYFIRFFEKIARLLSPLM